MPVQKNAFPGWGGLGLEKDPRAVYKDKSGRSKSTRAKEGNDPQELDATTPQDPGGVGEFFCVCCCVYVCAKPLVPSAPNQESDPTF